MGPKRGRAARFVTDPRLALPAIAFSALTYFHITRGYFIADDFINLYRIANLQPLEYLLTPHGGHVLLARNAVFDAMAQLFGMEARYYFWCVLLTHLVNVWLLFLLLVLLTESAHVASFGAALWGACPLQEGTLGWYSVYGHVLVATALLLILTEALRLQRLGVPPSCGRRAWWFFLALCAATSFGTGTALAAVLPVALVLLSPPSAPSRYRPPLLSLLVIVPVMYFVLLGAYDRVLGISGATLRPDVLLIVDWWITVRATLKMMAYALVRLLLAFWSPTHLSLPLTYALAVFVGGAITYAALTNTTTRRRFMAFALLVVSCYVVIAVGRGAFVVMTTEDGLNTASRHHYVGTMLLTVVCCIAVAQRPRGGWVGRVAPQVLLAAWYLMSAATYAILTPPSANNDSVRTRALNEVAALRAKIDSVPIGQPVYIKNRVFPPVVHFLVPVETFPGLAAAFVIYFPDNIVDGRPVYFVETRPSVLAATARGRRTRTLVVPGPAVTEQGTARVF